MKAGMDPDQLEKLKQWLFQSDDRSFAAIIIRRGRIVLEVERSRGMRKSAKNIKSCAKAICATVLATAVEESRAGRTPKKFEFDSPAFEFIPWAQPLSDPRKARITVAQLLNHTSGICPESTGVPNLGPWEVVLGHAGSAEARLLAFDPGTNLGYSTFGFYHAALVCEGATGRSYERFAIEHLLKPLGIEKWWFEFFKGGEGIGRHPTHALGLSARDMARIGWCLVNQGKWGEKQIVPNWFIEQTAAPTHSLRAQKDSRFGRDVESFSHGWELPARLTDGRGDGIPADARYKPGSGGQVIAWVPSLELVIARHTGGSGKWNYEEFVRRACKAAGFKSR